MMSALLAVAPATSPTTAPTTAPADARSELRRRILQAMGELDAPAPATRERATARLMGIGPAAMPMLREALKSQVSPEFRTRARQLLEDIPRQWHLSSDGGDVEGGFQCTLQCFAQTDPALPGPLLIVELRNVSPATRQLSDVRAVDIELPQQSKLFTSSLAEGRIVINRVGVEMPAIAGVPLIYEKGPRRTIDFNVGGNIQTLVNLSGAVRLPPGSYEAQFIYYAKSRDLLNDALDDLRSNVAKFSIEPNPASRPAR
jgi:hypothetical protein